jgi:hypothetical protein
MIEPEMSESGAPKTLEYRAAYPESGAPSPLLAVFLCLPGLICRVALGEIILPIAFHFRIGTVPVR